MSRQNQSTLMQQARQPQSTSQSSKYQAVVEWAVLAAVDSVAMD